MILKLAQDFSKIRSLKDKLNKNLKNYPLFNSIKYTRNFEKALKDVYDDKLRLFRN